MSLSSIFYVTFFGNILAPKNCKAVDEIDSWGFVIVGKFFEIKNNLPNGGSKLVRDLPQTLIRTDDFIQLSAFFVFQWYSYYACP